MNGQKRKKANKNSRKRWKLSFREQKTGEAPFGAFEKEVL